MCLALIAETARPTATEIRDAALTNRDGIGVAYRTPHDRLITWEKGLTLEVAQERAATLPLPFIMHFRLATHGGESPLLCHPFPISRNVGVTLHGQARELLFHNGIWNEHARFQRRAALRGPVSDTRIMAYVLWKESAQEDRAGVARFIAQQAGRLALFTPEGIETFGSWTAGTSTLADTTEGCLYSNLNHCWSRPLPQYFRGPRAQGSLYAWDNDAWDDDTDLESGSILEWDAAPTPERVIACGGCGEPVLDGSEAAKIDGKSVCQDCLDHWVTPTQPRRDYFPTH